MVREHISSVRPRTILPATEIIGRSYFWKEVNPTGGVVQVFLESRGCRDSRPAVTTEAGVTRGREAQNSWGRVGGSRARKEMMKEDLMVQGPSGVS